MAISETILQLKILQFGANCLRKPSRPKKTHFKLAIVWKR